MRVCLPVLFLCAAMFSACGAETPPDRAVTGDGHGHPHDSAHAGAHEHTERTGLGKLEIAGYAIDVFQLAKIDPGTEADFDLEFAAGVALPETVRGWIGVESGQGSMKARFGKETDTRMHGHPEVPDPIPPGSALWLEIEGVDATRRGSIAYR